MLTAKTYKENNPNIRVDFNDVKFNSKIQEKGLNVTWEKMCVCPCRKDASSQAVVDCVNCGGTGWYYFDSIEMKALISGASFQKSYLMWTENLTGSVIVSIDPYYKIGWMDKITVKDAETIFSEVKLTKILNEDDGIKSISLRYKPILIIGAFSYLDSEEPLKQISLDNLQYSSTSNIVIINDDAIIEGESVSVIYQYNPSYLVIDHLNDYRNTYVKNKLSQEELRKMPIKVLAKKTHLVLI